MKTTIKPTKKSSVKNLETFAESPSMSSYSTTAALLAIEGGVPVRCTALPCEFPGASFIDEEELELVTSVVRAHSPHRFYGPHAQNMVDMLEHEWCLTFGHQHALGVASGSAALSIAISALNLGPGDEVLVPGYLWLNCVSAIVRAGAIPRLVDIDDTFCMSAFDLKAKITSKTRAVLCVHMSGAPGRIKEIAALCKKKGLFLIEDCGQAAGASVDGIPVGRFGDIATFSFQLNKNMTSGEGGMVVCQDATLFRRIVALHDWGYPRSANGQLETSSKKDQLWGMGARMAELPGALALAQLRKLPEITGAMRKAKWIIRNALSDIHGLTFRNIVDPAGDSGPFLLMLLPSASIARRFIDALRAEGIAGPQGSQACMTLSEWGMHWYSNIPSLVHKRSNSRDGFPWTHPDNAFAKNYKYAKGALAVCDDYQARGAFITIASTLTEDDVLDIIMAVRKVARVVLA